MLFSLAHFLLPRREQGLWPRQARHDRVDGRVRFGLRMEVVALEREEIHRPILRGPVEEGDGRGERSEGGAAREVQGPRKAARGLR